MAIDSTEHENTDPDSRLEELLDGVRVLRTKCQVEPALRMTNEAKRLAKSERRLMPYLLANFYVMNLTQDTFDHEAGREAAIENIALLESPDRARAFQPDYDELDYERTVQWMSACSYDNLATATGMLQGYNSPGMQACIADGIAVCRRTGKTQCITCFREYATNVHRAADDLAMAMHHARTNVMALPSAENDRRFVGARDLAELLLLAGQLQPAWDSACRALALAETYHTPLRAKRMARVMMRTIGYLAEKPEWVEAGKEPASEVGQRGEDPAQDLRDDLAESLGDAARQDFAKAVERLTPWDQKLSERKCWNAWFEVRLHLVALSRLAGDMNRATRAREATLEASEGVGRFQHAPPA